MSTSEMKTNGIMQSSKIRFICINTENSLRSEKSQCHICASDQFIVPQLQIYPSLPCFVILENYTFPLPADGFKLYQQGVLEGPCRRRGDSLPGSYMLSLFCFFFLCIRCFFFLCPMMLADHQVSTAPQPGSFPLSFNSILVSSHLILPASL